MKRFQGFFIFVAAVALATFPVGAEQFGSISVSLQPLTSGETYHGYREYRILVENRSDKEPHEVTLVYPDRAFNSGNSISRIARTVSLAPGTRATVPIWQPPLPQNGSGQLRVLIDNDRPEVIGLAGNAHMNHSSGSVIPAAILVSRSLNFDDLARALKMENKAFSATMATGPRDSGTRRGLVPTAWTPDTSSSGPHWIELDYATPIKADRLRIYETMGFASGGEIILTGVSGTNFPAIRMLPTAPTRPGAAREFTFSLTPEPIKTVRLDFGSAYAGMISIDAVELAGSAAGGGSVWASAARASSESTSGAAYSSGSGRSGVEAIQLLRAESDTPGWSDSWLSYTPFDAVVLTSRDFRLMPAAIQDALWRYTECGGNLIVFGAASVPSTWTLSSKPSLPGGETLNAGLGRCFRFKSDRVTDLSAETWKELGDTIGISARSWQMLPDENTANHGFPIVENIRIPVRGMVVIMLAFVIVIGPVNIIFLSRRNRRTWLLWTIPAISFFTSLVVFAYSFLREGITADVRIEGLTLLDQVNRRAATVGTTAFYCPLTPGNGLLFSSETEATPLVERGGYERGAEREMDWTQGQHLTRGWVTARVPAYFGLRKAETRRERIQVEGSGAQMSIVNGLGAPIKNLWLADQAGHIYAAKNIPAGQKASLTAFTDVPKVTEQLGPRALSEKMGLAQSIALEATNAVAYLTPGTYLADMETNPFLENGLGAKAKSSRTKARAIVYGLLENGGQP